MNVTETHQKADSFLVSALLAVVGGFLDAYTYVLRGGVLANAQTGNMVFLVINLTERNFKQALFYLIPILFFVVGVFIVEKIRFWKHSPSALHWQQIVLVLELVLLFIISFIPNSTWNMAVNISISLICSMQVQSFRTVSGNPFASTMCTGNLRSGSECLFLYTQTNDKRHLQAGIHYFAIILFFLTGVFLGSLFSQIIFEKSTLFCCLILFVCFILLKKEPALSAKLK